MKKTLLLPALLLSSAAQAQMNALKVDIFQPIISTLAVSFEHKLSDQSSFQIGVAGTFNYRDSGFGSNTDEPSTSGFALTPEYRFYLSEKHVALEGFYIAPFVRYQYLSMSGTGYQYDSQSGSSTYHDYQASLNAFGLGATVGRHWIFKQRFSLDIFTGPGYTFSSVSSDNSGYAPSRGDFVGYYNNTNYDFRGGATFGLAF